MARLHFRLDHSPSGVSSWRSRIRSRYLNGAESRGIDEDYVTGEHLRAGEPAAVSHMDLARGLEDPGRFRALVCWNINLAASNPEQARLRRALEREDLFTVAVDLFPTDTTDLADVVLPAASFLESDDLVASYFNRSLSAQVKAGEPLGESLPNSEVTVSPAPAAAPAPAAPPLPRALGRPPAGEGEAGTVKL